MSEPTASVLRLFSAASGRSEGLLSPARGGILAATEMPRQRANAPGPATETEVPMQTQPTARERLSDADLIEQVIVSADRLERGFAIPLGRSHLLVARSNTGKLRVAGWDSGWASWWRGDFDTLAREHLAAMLDRRGGYYAVDCRRDVEDALRRAPYAIQGVGKQNPRLGKICDGCREFVGGSLGAEARHRCGVAA